MHDKHQWAVGVLTGHYDAAQVVLYKRLYVRNAFKREDDRKVEWGTVQQENCYLGRFWRSEDTTLEGSTAKFGFEQESDARDFYNFFAHGPNHKKES